MPHSIDVVLSLWMFAARDHSRNESFKKQGPAFFFVFVLHLSSHLKLSTHSSIV